MISSRWLALTKRLKRLVRSWLKRCLGKQHKPLTDREQALNLLAAIDAGGVPLNPARVNDIARNLGLDVSRKAKVEDTVARIRAVMGK